MPVVSFATNGRTHRWLSHLTARRDIGVGQDTHLVASRICQDGAEEGLETSGLRVKNKRWKDRRPCIGAKNAIFGPRLALIRPRGLF